MLQRLQRDAKRERPRDRLLELRSAKLLMRGGELREPSGERRREDLRRSRSDDVLSGRPDVKPNVSVRNKRRERGNGIVIGTGTGIGPETVIERGNVMIVEVIGIAMIATGDMMMILPAEPQSAKLRIQKTRQSPNSRRKRLRDWSKKL
jgi:hypothetical protein